MPPAHIFFTGTRLRPSRKQMACGTSARFFIASGMWNTSWPCSSEPQPYSAPSFASASVWFSPQHTSAIATPRGKWIAVGVACFFTSFDQPRMPLLSR